MPFHQQDTASLYTANHKYDEWEANTLLTAVHKKKYVDLPNMAN